MLRIGVIAAILLGAHIRIIDIKNINFLSGITKKLLPDNKMNSSITFASVLGVAIVTVLFGIAILQLSSQQTFGMTKWLPFLSAPFILIFFMIRFKYKRAPSISSRWLILVANFATAFYVLMLLLTYLFGETKQDLIVFFMALSIILFAYFDRGGLPAIYGAIVGWVCLSSLLNWQVILGAIEHDLFIGLLAGMAIIVGFWKLSGEILCARECTPKWNLFLGAVVLSIIAVLSVRSDSLFGYGAVYHWEYFAGPIRALRNGGLLLYDVPSQYGFLNILLASMMPVGSSWQALYIFQTVLLMIAPCFIIAGLWNQSRSFSVRLILSALVVLSVFFADPEWIGPQPFPSSSVTRFIWCYILLGICLLWAKQKFFHFVLAFCWSAGVIWSAESCFYSTVIFAFIVIADAACQPNVKLKISHIKQFIYPAAGFLFVYLAAIYFIYKLGYGISPDFKLYFEYVLGYAGGHGYVPFDLKGPGNFLFMLFIMLGYICLKILNRKNLSQESLLPLAAATGCVWIISSYYLGRPVPQNVTAMLPIYVSCGLIGIQVASKYKFYREKAALSALLAALIFVAISPIFVHSWWIKLTSYVGYQGDITVRLPEAPQELVSAIEVVNPEALIPMVYFGNAAALPKLPIKYDEISEKTWSPVPLQIIQKPIRPERRDEFIKRYIGNKKFPHVILIQEFGADDQAVADFLSVSGKYYHVVNFEKVGNFGMYVMQVN